MQRVLGLGECLGEDVGDHRKFGLDRCLFQERMMRPSQRVDGAGHVVFGREALRRQGRRIDERLGMGEPAVARVEFRPLVFARRESLDFAQLPVETLSFAGERLLCGLGACQRALGALPLLPAVSDLGGVGSGVGVEQRTDGAGAGQALPGVLTMNVDQGFAEGAQLAGGGGCAIDPGATASLPIDGAAKEDGVVGIEAVVAQPGRQSGGRVEFGAEFGAICTFADDRRVGAVAEQQLQRVDQDGFARARFSRQGREACLELEGDLLDDDEVAQMNASESHVQEPPSFQCSLRRRVSK